MIWYVYILLCDQKMYYVGITNNVSKRMIDHMRGKSFFTKKLSDLRFVYAEKYNNKNDAASREKQIKRWSVAKKERLISGEIGYNACTSMLKRC